MVNTELAHLWKLVIYGQSVSRSGSDLHKIWFISSQKTEVDQIHIYWKLKTEFFNLKILLICRTMNKGSVLKLNFVHFSVGVHGNDIRRKCIFRESFHFSSSDFCFWINRRIHVFAWRGVGVSTQWWLFTYNSSSLEQTYFPHQMVIAQCHV